MPLRAGLDIQAVNRSSVTVDVAALAATARRALERLGYRRGELGLAFVAPDEIERLNSEHLGRSGPTNVIAFPLDADADRQREDESVPLLLGDVVVCPEVAAERAGAAGSALAGELCMLVIHGVIHVAGFDHETDSGEMERLQADLVSELCGPDQVDRGS